MPLAPLFKLVRSKNVTNLDFQHIFFILRHDYSPDVLAPCESLDFVFQIIMPGGFLSKVGVAEKTGAI